MKFYFNIMDPVLFDHDEFKYFTEREIAKVKLYTEKEALPILKKNERLDKENKSNHRTHYDIDLWPVYDYAENSYDPVECKDEKEARRYLIASENQSVFERQHDF